MNAGSQNRRNRQRASALKAWSQLITVALIFLLFIPRCVGCRSPMDPLIEKFYGGKMNRDGSINTDAATKEFLQEINSRNPQR